MLGEFDNLAAANPGPSENAPPSGQTRTWISPTVLRFLRLVGPGIITGASDDDPSGIGTYAVAGAQLGYASLWTAPFSFPLMAAVQFICAKIALVSGRGIAGVLRAHYPSPVLYAAVLGLILANTLNAAADMLAIAAGINLLIPVPLLVMIVPIAVSLLVFQIWGSYRWIARIFTALTLALFAYIGAAFYARPDWSLVLRGTLVPELRFDRSYLATLLAILGTTISPYLFFWQANEVVEEKASRRRKQPWYRPRQTTGDLPYVAVDVNLGMFFSNLVMFFILLASAATLHAGGRTDIDSAASAAEALRPLAGNGATVLMALGLIGTGLLTVPILTSSAAYAVCEAVGWKCSLDDKPAKAREFYLVMVVSTLVAALINFIGINPMKALYWTAVINGVLAGPLLVVIMLIANNSKVMHSHVNGLGLNILGWIAAVLMIVAAAGIFLGQ